MLQMLTYFTICTLLQPKEIGLPFTAYTAIDEVREVRLLLSCISTSG
jgi:hypothetical protein